MKMIPACHMLTDQNVSELMETWREVNIGKSREKNKNKNSARAPTAWPTVPYSWLLSPDLNLNFAAKLDVTDL